MYTSQMAGQVGVSCQLQVHGMVVRMLPRLHRPQLPALSGACSNVAEANAPRPPRTYTVAAASKAAAAQAAAAAASTATATAAAVPAWVQPVFIGCTIYTGALFAMMMLLPKWQKTRQIISSAKSYVPLALAYTALLIASWQPDTMSLILPGSLNEGLSGGFNPQFMPKLSAISELFSRPATFASLWVHVMLINLFVGKSVYQEGLRTGTPTFHSLLLSAACGPLGLLCHLLTKALYGVITMATGKDPRKPSNGARLSTGDGTITILPYSA